MLFKQVIKGLTNACFLNESKELLREHPAVGSTRDILPPPPSSRDRFLYSQLLLVTRTCRANTDPRVEVTDAPPRVAMPFQAARFAPLCDAPLVRRAIFFLARACRRIRAPRKQKRKKKKKKFQPYIPRPQNSGEKALRYYTHAGSVAVP